MVNLALSAKIQNMQTLGSKSHLLKKKLDRYTEKKEIKGYSMGC